MHIPLNQKYVVAFSAKADVEGHTINITLRENNLDYTVYASEDISLGTEWKRYGVVLESSTTDADGRVDFHLNGADVASSVWIDNLVFSEETEAVSDAVVVRSGDIGERDGSDFSCCFVYRVDF